MIVKNDLYDYKNRYIYQDTDFFKFSIDSILLAEFVDRKDLKGNILDTTIGFIVYILTSLHVFNTLISSFST